jgi:hypothetical protein
VPAAIEHLREGALADMSVTYNHGLATKDIHTLMSGLHGSIHISGILKMSDSLPFLQPSPMDIRLWLF